MEEAWCARFSSVSYSVATCVCPRSGGCERYCDREQSVPSRAPSSVGEEDRSHSPDQQSHDSTGSEGVRGQGVALSLC